MKKNHVKRLNPSALKTEEAFERINKKSDVDVAHMLLNMQTNGSLEPQTARVELSQKHLESPAPKNVSTHQPLETYEIFPT